MAKWAKRTESLEEAPVATIHDALKGRRCFVPHLSTENGVRGWCLDELVTRPDGGCDLKRIHGPDLFDITMDRFAVEMVKESQRC
jgi:hypothetical protein